MPVQPLTFRDILRTYADGVRGGTYDPQIESKRQRDFVAMLLVTASNDHFATTPYGEVTEVTRTGILQRLGGHLWDANVRELVAIASPSADDLFGKACELAWDIVRNI